MAVGKEHRKFAALFFLCKQMTFPVVCVPSNAGSSSFFFSVSLPLHLTNNHLGDIYIYYLPLFDSSVKQEVKCTYELNTEANSRKDCCRGKSNKYYIFWVCVCSLSYPACNAHAPYYIFMWPVWLYHICPYYLINGTIFGGKISYWTQNVCFDFCYKFCLKHFSF